MKKTLRLVALLCLYLSIVNGAFAVTLLGSGGMDPKIVVESGIVKVMFGFISDSPRRDFKKLCVKVALSGSVDIIGGKVAYVDKTIVIDKGDINGRMGQVGWMTDREFETLMVAEYPANSTPENYRLYIIEAKPCPDSGSSMLLGLGGMIALAATRRFFRRDEKSRSKRT